MQSIYDKIKTLEITTNRKVNGLFAGNYRSSFQGSGIEVDDVRPYEFGDNAKNIDWITTAKLGEPYIKKFSETRELSTFIILDVSASMQFSSQKGTRKADVALETAAVLMFSAFKNHEAVGAILFNNGIEKYIPAKKGKRHILQILKAMILAYENPKAGKGSLNAALDNFNVVSKKHPICFIITDTDVIDEYGKRALKVANLKNDLVYLHVSDPFEKEINDSNYIRLQDFETKKASSFLLSSKKMQERYKKLRKDKEEARVHLLRRSGIDHVLLSTTKSVFPVLFNFFKRRQNSPRRA